MGVSRASNGIVTAAFGIGGLVAGSLIGYVSDRTQNRIGPQLCASVLYVVSGLVLYFAKHFYQIVIFRLILGIASSIADTMLFTTVADVYPANLLGFKMAVIFVFDNIGNMLGPLLGGKAYEHMGVGGIAIIAIALGLFELCMILIFVRNSLDIRRTLASSNVTQVGSLADKPVKPTINSGRSSTDTHSVVESESGFTDVSIISKPEQSQNLGCNPNSHTPNSSKKRLDLHILRLLLQLPVAGPTVSIFVATGLQTVIETILPLRLFDKFGYSPATIGIVFLIVGGVLILAMPAVGYVNDTVVSRHGEYMRYYTIATGALCVFLSQIVMSLAGSYVVLVFGYSLFAISTMVVIVPAQSAFGDFINSSESHAMAQCYSLAWIAEGLANIILPPIASGMYATVGFLTMLIEQFKQIVDSRMAKTPENVLHMLKDLQEKLTPLAKIELDTLVALKEADMENLGKPETVEAANTSPDKRATKRPRTFKSGPAQGEPPALDFSTMEPRKQQVMTTFLAYRNTLDAHYDQRERVIKCSRDITALSKKMVFSLLRITQDSPEKVFKDVEFKHNQVLELFSKMSKEMQGSNAMKYNRQATPGIQEYIEAVGLWRFLQHNELITKKQVLESLTIEGDGKATPLVSVTDEDYLLGISDLPGEVNRYCINSIGKGDRDAVSKCLAFLQMLKEGVSLVLSVRKYNNLEKKVPVLNSSLEKIEKAFYSMTIRECEMKSIDPEIINTSGIAVECNMDTS
ncbi:hypothetical protein J3B01_002961 [Coemansia erecta]|nr:hypothetical protein J3B01_002961 [Coemansia erecta]